MKPTRLTPYFASAVFLLGLGFSGAAQSAVIDPLLDCANLDGGVQNRVTTNIGCQILSPLGGNVNDPVGGDPSNWIVNTAGGTGFFGISNWQYDGRWEDPPDSNGDPLEFDPADPTLNLVTLNGHAQSGTWTLDPSFVYGDLLFLFKDGGSTNLTGFLMTGFSGSYATPFTSPPFPLPGAGNDRDISHVSIYYRPGVPVPEPRTLLLLGLGLGLLGIVFRRKAHKGSIAA
ncbi:MULTISPECIES: PEP-CTERM sorting domain-containing protein [unclassified Thioalkalivibrio]|uniref:PEP-CTERM sorting domain-containing protein n=1 Tax=unclassified Thioalkalivibrio TaxID=2621013 RepID=UPI00039B0D50|nr:MULTISPECIES: PEP-CTERM sorting domain-containing protein [unclassified Thioalkalivibrio]